jgi:peptidoglycan/LPS O-acetylase OafA/YrhL
MTQIIPSLNGLRALSIFAVLISHIQDRSLHLQTSSGGQIGVNIFFVISGFLITLLLMKEEERNRSISLKDFFIRRSLRIFPVYFLLLFVYFILQNLSILDIPAGSWLTSLTYTRYFFDGEWETGHLWSLSVEEHFYLIWPFVFVYLKRKRITFAWSIIIIIPFVRLFTNISFMHHMFSRGDAIMWGCVFALYHQPLTRFIKAKPSYLMVLPFLLLLCCLASKKIFHVVGNDSTLYHVLQAFAGSYGTLTNICIGFITLISINYKHNLYYRFLNTTLMHHIGVLSYSIYIWQQLFFSEHIGPLSTFPYNIILIFVVAIISYYLVEQPFLRLKNHFIKQKPSEEPTAVPVLSTTP